MTTPTSKDELAADVYLESIYPEWGGKDYGPFQDLKRSFLAGTHYADKEIEALKARIKELESIAEGLGYGRH